MALKILLVDPDEDWLYSTKGKLETELYLVDVVSNGKDAQLALYNNKYFAVVMNVETKNHSGLQVLRFIKTNYSTQRVVMIMEKLPENPNDEDALTPDKLKKMGAMEVLVKPFEIKDLLTSLEGHQSLGDMISNLPRNKGESKEEEVDLKDDQFTSVKIDEFYSTQPVLFDVFIKLKSDRYIKILHAGDSFSKDRLDKYKTEKKVEKLFFQKKDLGKFIKFNNYLAGKSIDNQKVNSVTKVRMIKNVAEKFMEQSFIEGMKPQIIDQGKEICENVYKLVENQRDLYKVLRSFQEFDPSAYTHAFIVSMFSTSIIKQFEWQSKVTIETAAFACLFHDIGKMKLPKELLDKRPEEMTDDEKNEYYKHCEYGLQMLDGNNLINNSVKQIIYQHHENFDGTGFPENKKGSKILTLANIVHLADDFAHTIVEKNLKPLDALKELLGNRNQLKLYNSQIVENLIKVFTDPDKIKKDFILPSNSNIIPSKKAS